MNKTIERRYDALLKDLTKCKECRFYGKDKNKGCDHIFKPEPAINRPNYGKGKRIFVIAHMPRKNQELYGLIMNHSLKEYKSISKFKADSDKEEPFSDWTITKRGITKYVRKVLGHNDVSYVAFSNFVKCQRYNNGKPTGKNPNKDMYKFYRLT